MHEHNSFITLTYNDENLVEKKLQYRDFQLFMKRLRRSEPHLKISTFVTGEYGEKTKRPHWHAIIFNWRPDDCEHHYTNETGDKVYTSEKLSKLWGKGHCEIGSVTFQSAGYVARYAAKKLVHGTDGHEYEPISKKSSKRAIGKSWLEENWRDLRKGSLTMPDGTQVAIPRYYDKWMLKQIPEYDLQHYIDNKTQNQNKSIQQKQREELDTEKQNQKRREAKHSPDIATTKLKAKIKNINDKFKRLQAHLKEI